MCRIFLLSAEGIPVARPVARRKKDGANRPSVIQKSKPAPGRNCRESSVRLAVDPNAGYQWWSSAFSSDTIKTKRRASVLDPPRILTTHAELVRFLRVVNINELGIYNIALSGRR